MAHSMLFFARVITDMVFEVREFIELLTTNPTLVSMFGFMFHREIAFFAIK